MINHISQSFIKDFKAYDEGNECGIIIREKYVNGRVLDDPDADPGLKELGAYFEFIAFGSLPKSGVVPTPVMLSDGKTMNAAYRLATINAKRVREYLTVELGLVIKKKAWKVTKGRFNGTIDLLCECTKEIHFDTGIVWRVGDVIVIDLKYSGLISETTPAYNKHGWKWSKVQKEYHGIQATHYHILTDAPFYFFVCQSNNKEGTLSDMKFFHIPVDGAMKEQHIVKANDYFDRFQVLAAAEDLKPRPSFSRCSKCVLRNECTVKHEFPHPEIINITEP